MAGMNSDNRHTLLVGAFLLLAAASPRPAWAGGPGAPSAVGLTAPDPDSCLRPLSFDPAGDEDPLDAFQRWRTENHLNLPVLPAVQKAHDRWARLHGPAGEPRGTAGAEAESAVPEALQAGPNACPANGLPAYQGGVSIAVNPMNGLQVVAGALSLQQSPGAGCQSPTGGASKTYGPEALYASSDGGQTWTASCGPWPSDAAGGCAAPVGGGKAFLGADLGLAWDAGGNVYAVYTLLSAAWDITYNLTCHSSAVVLAKSANGGLSWSALGTVVNDLSGTTLFDNKALMAVDATSGKAYSHSNRLYVTWDQNNVQRVAFSDTGASGSWTTVVLDAAATAGCPAGSTCNSGGNLAVGADGTVCAVWNRLAQGGGGAQSGEQTVFSKSVDGGVTWSTPSPVASHQLLSFGSNNKVPAQDKRGVNAFASLGIDLTGGTHGGTLYAAYSDFPTGVASGADLNTYLVRSTDGGSSWGQPQKVNDDAGGATQFLPWLSVDPATGGVNLAWYDTRNDPNNRKAQVYFSRSADGGATFSGNVKVTQPSGAFSNASADYSNENSSDNPNYGANQYGDYLQVSALSDAAYVGWTDTRQFYPVSGDGRVEDTAVAEVCSSAPGTPTGLAATASSPSQVVLAWSAGVPAGAAYKVYRAVSSCASSPVFTLLAAGVAATTYTDTTPTGGMTYAYQVSALSAPCESARTPCAQVTTPCPTPPDFPGLSAVANPADVTCTLALSWPLGVPYCGGPVVYNVYRGTSPSFVPSSANRVASAVLDTAYTDSQALVSGVTYYYVVRAVDQGNAMEDANTVVKSGVPTGPYSPGNWTDDAGDTGPAQLVLASPWSVAATGGHAGPKVYRTGTYGNGLCAALVTPPILLGTDAQLTFWSAYDIETGRDKGLVELSADGGSTWQRVPVNYPDTANHTGDACGYPATGTYFSHTYAAPAYAVYTASLGTWTGQSVRLRWRLSTNGSVTGAGWWVDDISITNIQVPGTCVTGPGCTPPSPPTLDSAVGTCAGVDLSWTAGQGLATGFNVYRALTCGATATELNSGPVAGTAFTDATAAPGQSYSYVVRAACDAGGLGESNDSNCLTAATLKPAAPGAPTFAAVTCGSMTVTWAAVPGADGYDLYRATGACGATPSPVATGLTSTSYSDTSLAAGTSYAYRVVAHRGACASDPGPCAAQATASPIGAPSGLAATGACPGNTVTWNPVAGALSYALYRGAACGTADTTLSGVTSPYLDDAAPRGTAVYYWVEGVNACGPGTASACATATRPAPPLPPANVVAAGSCSAVTVSWDPVQGATGYTLTRGTTCGVAQSTFPGVSSPFADNTASAGTTYQYWVSASTDCGDTGPGACAAAARTAMPDPPPAPALGAVTCSSVTVALPSSAGATGYDLYRASGGCSGSASLLASDLPGPTYTDTTLAPGVRYGYYLVARGPCGLSSPGPCSEAVTLSAPVITAQPQGQAVQPGQAATLSVTAAGSPPLAYQWYAGASGNASGLVPGATQASFTTPPLTSDLSFWVRVSNGCGQADSLAATVGPCSPSCTASASGAPGTAPLQVTFSATAAPSSPSCGSDVAFDWDFGDGSAHSSLASPEHTYVSPGTFAWTLTAVVGGLPCFKSGTVEAWGPLSASIATDAPAGTAPFTASFTSAVSGGDGHYAYAWAFGDGSSASTAAPSHTYASAGQYPVTLTVTDTAGHSTASNALAETVWASMAVAISGTPSGSGDTVPVAYDFAASAAGGSGGYTYAWTFGDGETGTGAQTAHTFVTAGTWSVSCTVADSAGNSATAAPLGVTVYAPLRVTGSAAPPAAVAGLPITFAATASGGDGHYAYAWAFGDGTTGTGATATHAYASPGTYTATVTVTDTASHSAPSTVPVPVWAPLSVAITRSSGSGDTLPQTCGFSASAQGGSGTYTYAWSFGDGGTGSGAAVLHAFALPGTWSVSCTATDAASNTAASNTLTYTFYTPLVAEGSASPNPVVLGDPVAFSTVATGGDGTYTGSWDFGDGSTASGLAAGHTYASTGTFSARVTVSDGAGHTAVSPSLPVVVKPVPPQVTAVKKLAAPLRLKITGINFSNGCAATIDGSPVTVKYKSTTSLVLKGVSALVPKGRTVHVVVTNPDGGASTPFPFTR